MPLLPFVCKAFWRQCRYVEVEWDFAEYPELCQKNLIDAEDKTCLTFCAFRVTKISLRNWGINTSSDMVSIARKFPHLRHLDMRRCHCVRNSEWDVFLDTLGRRCNGYLGRLQKFDNPFFRIDCSDITCADVEWMKALIPAEEEDW